MSYLTKMAGSFFYVYFPGYKRCPISQASLYWALMETDGNLEQWVHTYCLANYYSCIRVCKEDGPTYIPCLIPPTSELIIQWYVLKLAATSFMFVSSSKVLYLVESLSGNISLLVDLAMKGKIRSLETS